MYTPKFIRNIRSLASAVGKASNGACVAWIAILALLLTSGTALAADAPATLNAGDTAWMLVATALVMFMTPGLGLFYAGMARKKNVLSSLMHSYVALAIIGIQWVVFGYTLAFGTGNSIIGDLSQFLLLGMTHESLHGTIPTYVFMWFQGMFAIITPALISGAIAERMKFSSYVVFILVWATVVYDPIAHWVWADNGWINTLGAFDFAGGTVVHLSSGISALAMALMLGRRKGYPNESFIPHNLTMTLVGVAFLWFGWFGFNAGSALKADGIACLAFTTTMTATAGAAFSWMMMEWIFHRKPSALGLGSGCVAGLVVVTPAAGYITPAWSLLLGLSAGVLCYYGVRIKAKCGFDDALDVVGVHGLGGAWGAIATGIFVTVGGSGLILGNPAQVGKQAIAVGVVAVYAYVMTWIIGTVIDKTMGLRVTEEEEIIGLDSELHGEVGYTQ